MLSASRLEFVTWIPPSERAAGAPISNRQFKIFNCLQRHFQPTLSAKRPSTARLPPTDLVLSHSLETRLLDAPGSRGVGAATRLMAAASSRWLLPALNPPRPAALDVSPFPTRGFAFSWKSLERSWTSLEFIGRSLDFFGEILISLDGKSLFSSAYHETRNRGGNGLPGGLARSAAAC